MIKTILISLPRLQCCLPSRCDHKPSLNYIWYFDLFPSYWDPSLRSLSACTSYSWARTYYNCQIHVHPPWVGWRFSFGLRRGNSPVLRCSTNGQVCIQWNSCLSPRCMLKQPIQRRRTAWIGTGRIPRYRQICRRNVAAFSRQIGLVVVRFR